MAIEIFTFGDREIKLFMTKKHRFGTDAMLLADFANVRHKDVVCDFCTGCGIIPVLILRKYAPRFILGLDIMEEAAEIFGRTIAENDLANVASLCADLRELPKNLPESLPHSFDVITCNPPYKAAGAGIVSESDSEKAARHETQCGINDVCRAAKKMLRSGGRLVLCNRPERLADVICAMRENGIEPKRLKFVSKTPETPPWLFLLEGRKDGGSFLSVESGVFIK
ncbi:MAG: methyltransferase [Ruminococcus sp.]|jgi:tRNA1(Val) A37 N6-methylase TrmN6|nr:methyltransferase [Ruminococcus sp.]